MKNELPSCPAQITLSFINNKWKVLILAELMLEDTQRFNELRKALPKISQKILTQNLRIMEDIGLVNRKVYAEVPPRVEYSLTYLGLSLRPIMDAMINWGEEYRAMISKDKK